MQASGIPVKFSIPFGADAGGSYIRQVPTASQIGITNGAASLHDGFPPLCFLPVGSGGVPPFGQDFNGILNQSTAWAQWLAAGSPVQYDGTFSTAIGGYPKGAVVRSASTFGTFWFCTSDNNTSDPDTGGSGWTAFTPGSPFWHEAVDTSSTSGLITATVTPVIGAYAAGLMYEVIPAQNCSGSTVANFNGLGNRPLVRWNASALQSGDYVASQPLLVADDGTHLRITCFVPSDIVALTVTYPSIGPARNVLLSQTAHGTGNVTVPAGVTWIYYIIVGAGGGGAGAGGGSTWSGGGGAAGGTAQGWLAVSPSDTISWIDGEGGAGCAQGNGVTATTGATSSITHGVTTISATGGGGGQAGSSTSAGGGPGIGSGGQINLYGGIGGDGNNGNASVQGGAGGASSLGGGGRTSTIAGSATNGLAPGSGAGGIWGTGSAASGGNGADGAVILMY